MLLLFGGGTKQQVLDAAGWCLFVLFKCPGIALQRNNTKVVQTIYNIGVQHRTRKSVGVRVSHAIFPQDLFHVWESICNNNITDVLRV